MGCSKSSSGILGIEEYREYVKRINESYSYLSEREGAFSVSGVALSMSWAIFSFYIFEHNAWLPRRNERISYVGDSQWRYSMSLDIDLFNLLESYEEQCLGYYEYLIGATDEFPEASSGEFGDASTGASLYYEDHETELLDYLYLPVLEFPKSAQFMDFDLRDASGCALNLMMRAESAQICLSMLIGGMARVHGMDYGADQGFPLFDSDHPLTYVLFEWFKKTMPPDGFAEYDDDCKERLKEVFYTDLEEVVNKKLASKAWEEKTCNLVRESFRYYYEDSEVFAYFVRRFAFQWMAFTPIAIETCRNKPTELIKCSYTLTRDIFDSKSKENAHRAPLGQRLSDCFGLNGKSLNIVMTGVGTAETSHVIVEAPEGLQYIITKDCKKDTAWGARDSSAFWIIDELLPSNSEGENGIEAFGSLSPGCATVKSVFPWQETEGSDKKVRQRNLPIGDNRESRHLLRLSLVPVLGVRAVAQFALIMFSVVMFLLCCIGGGDISGLASPSFGGLVSEGLPAFLSMIGLLIDRPTYMRKRAAIWPAWITRTCIITDACFLIAVSCMQLMGRNDGFAPAVLGLVICALGLILHTVIVVRWLVEIRRSDKMADGHVFKVPVYGLSERT